MHHRAVFVFPVIAYVLGCGGSQTSPSESGWSDELSDPSMHPSQMTGDPIQESEKPAPISAQAATPATEIRVRHDVMIANDAPHDPVCSCLAVVVGSSASEPRLSWMDTPPVLESDVMVVAVSGKGISCPGLSADGPHQPSISGFERDGVDIVVTIENLPPGRPVAAGAVIPRPTGGGSVYVKPRAAKVPYGRPLAGAPGRRCKVH